MKRKVAVAMSGGVDSATAAVLLKDKGDEVIGLTAQIWPSGKIGSPEKINNSKRVAAKLKIPHYVVDLKKLFEKRIIANFCQEYKKGKTPNPCIRCNKYIKFTALLKAAEKLGANYIATGHYAKVEYDKRRKRYLLKKGIDAKKDQSYFLYKLSQEQLRHTLFPLGNYKKRDVKKIALSMNLPVAKEESQEICFIPDNGYGEFIKNYSSEPIKVGRILDKKGNVLGEHQGIIFYTIGQRKGIKVASKKPLYVTVIDSEKNTIVVGRKEELFYQELIAEKLNFIATKELKKSLKVKAKIRYLHPLSEATIFPLNKTKVRVKFAESQWAITPGQSIVFYDGESVLGGGIISKTLLRERR
ncbi:MAG: tRNA 2-thiouridine(34) synthase MnmA [Candidatus Omnitrophica bacterium]|nr:tRNA 2-thiouridine(34) synthase MnmA [Candidatus Omnitrophota bacterium]